MVCLCHVCACFSCDACVCRAQINVYLLTYLLKRYIAKSNLSGLHHCRVLIKLSLLTRGAFIWLPRSGWIPQLWTAKLCQKPETSLYGVVHKVFRYMDYGTYRISVDHQYDRQMEDGQVEGHNYDTKSALQLSQNSNSENASKMKLLRPCFKFWKLCQ